MSDIFYSKASTVRAIRFVTNNEPDDKNMNAVCIMANQGRPANSPHHCWHNGTDIFVAYHPNPDDGYMRAQVGDWIVVAADGSLDVMTDDAFTKAFGYVPTAVLAKPPKRYIEEALAEVGTPKHEIDRVVKREAM